MNNNEPLSNISKTKDSLNVAIDNNLVNFKKYSFVTSSLIIALIYFVFTILFILVAGTIGVMVSFFLQRYNLIGWLTNIVLWQKVTIFGTITFFTANFCLFEAEAIVAKLIETKSNLSKKRDLQSLLKVRPKNWQKIFYSMLLFLVSTLGGYYFVVNYISWIYNQFWS